MAVPFLEKARIVLITAALTSVGWFVAGATLLDRREAADIEGEIAAKQSPDLIVERESEEAETAPDRTGAQASTLPEEERATLRIPVQGVAARDLSDTFTDERGGGTRLHEAIDIMADRGTSVVAAAPGTIESLFRSEAGGNTVYVRSDDRLTIYYYAHLDEYAPGLNEGQRVRLGQRLGTVGSSGNADPAAPHLHFEIMRTTADADWWEPATSVNPYPLLVG